MEDILKKLPTWLIVAAVVYVAGLVSYAVFENRTVEFWPPKIYEKGEGQGPAPAGRSSEPWVTTEAVARPFPVADCPVRLPAVLAIAKVANAHPATWGGEGGMIWFGDWQGDTVWLACLPNAPIIIVGAAGAEASATKGAVDALMGLIAK
ncbi:hypothetical protein QU487_13110 [Crenobacter sp. SG2305]|uniref:hypothetical protein n=1 Tax=Crenobacter oryzisoli TaxID=3056844 RepID=UPI0025AB5B54|nr:hypothetical protein [Crenobacter sp. SG2305]MDN0083685.1 hypothetical protein [Crenobacter sp. SG2305]